MRLRGERPLIGLGLISFKRPEYAKVALASVQEFCQFDAFIQVEDVCPVGVAKNQALRYLLDKGCDWLFLMEEDMEITSPLAITGYLDACKTSGYDHLMFHAHGTHNPASRGRHNTGAVTYWPNCVGAYCVFSRRSLEDGGLFDENFRNSWEHVEHSQRLARLGYTSAWPLNADATGSENWLHEQPGAIDNSSIRHSPEWLADFDRGQHYWRANMPETYKMIWP